VARVLPLILLFVLGAGYTYRVEGRLECQARYNEANNNRARILTEVTDQERGSTRRADDAEAAVFRHPAAFIPREDRTPQQQREIDALAHAWGAATIQRQQDRAEADKARAEHPVPPPPSELCG
jgi:hypothetical protein